jgi:glycine/D-amino acid oxidase-like deaminating enzyme
MYPIRAVELDLTVSRRRLIGSAGLGAAGLILGGCATKGTQTGSLASSTSALCLAPVKASRDRLIRQIVGLRPYRESGFVVRAESLGAKRLVHNYGHGGAGITLSWGTSKLATQLGLQGHRGPVAVLGAGALGLTTARLVQEAGFPVTIYAEALPPETTSNIAGGQWLPSSYYEGSAVTPEWRQQNAAAIEHSYRRFQIMVGEDYGIRWVPHYFAASGPPPRGTDGGAEAIRSGTKPGLTWLGPGEHPFPLDWVRRYQVMFVEPQRFLRQLMRDIHLAGGKVVVRRLASTAEVAALTESLVFNCTGLGARELFGDQELRPVRGQLAVLLPQPEVDYAFSGPNGYMFPRSDGIILGGTFDENEWSTVPDPATTDRMIAQHQEIFGKMRCGTARPGTRPDLA